MNPLALAKAPLWTAQMFTAHNSFNVNPILGSARLNAWGLHEARVRAAYALIHQRRERFASAVPESLRRTFDEQGYVAIPDFLPPAIFDALTDQVSGFRAKARERWEGDTLLRKIAVDAEALGQAPAIRGLVDSGVFRALMRYGEGRADAPAVYFETLHRHARPDGHDYQTDLHTDTFHPTTKAWLYLTDVPLESGPLLYVPGSHRLTPERLAWERKKCLEACAVERGKRNASFRVTEDELRAMGFDSPIPLVVRANTLVVADTFGIHARGPAAGPAQRVELWAIGRRSPFLPFKLDRAVQRTLRPRRDDLWKIHRTVGAFDE